MGQGIRAADLLNGPNLLTMGRMAVVAPFLWAIWTGRVHLAVLFLLIGAATDYFDGIVARKFDQQSAIGEVLDLFSDRLLTTPALVVMYFAGYYPRVPGYPWLPLLFAVPIVLGDFAVFVGLARYVPLKIRHPSLQYPSPPVVAKWAYGMQLAALSLVILSPAYEWSGWLGGAVIVFIASACMVTIIGATAFLKKAQWIFMGGSPLDHLAE